MREIIFKANMYGEWKIRKDGNIFDNAELLEV